MNKNSLNDMVEKHKTSLNVGLGCVKTFFGPSTAARGPSAAATFIK